MKRCALIIPYFGTKWPIWFSLYLYSLEKNKDILDVYLFTDIIPPKNVPKNAKFYNLSFQQYCEMVSKKLDIRFKPKSPYKLCDLKPFLPIIHSDILIGYDYVGFGDLDLIYGDLSSWLNSINKNKSLISTHIDRVSGHFVLIKNSPKILRKAFFIPKWKEILQDDKHHGTDEGRFSFVHFPILWGISCVCQYKLKWKNLGKNICKPLKLFYPSLFLKEMFTTPLPKSNDKWWYNNGKIFDYKGREIPYLHFLFFKKTQYNPNNHLYWRDGYYELKDLIEDKCICIDIDGIRYDELGDA